MTEKQTPEVPQKLLDSFQATTQLIPEHIYQCRGGPQEQPGCDACADAGPGAADQETARSFPEADAGRNREPMDGNLYGVSARSAHLLSADAGCGREGHAAWTGDI